MGIKDLFRKNDAITKDFSIVVKKINLEIYDRLVKENLFDLFFNNSLSSIEFTGNGFRLVFFVNDINRTTKEMSLDECLIFFDFKKYYYSLKSKDSNSIKDDINIKQFISLLSIDFCVLFYRKYSLPNTDKLREISVIDYSKIFNKHLNDI